MNDALLDEMKVTVEKVFFVVQSVCPTLLLNSYPFLFQSACVKVEKSERRVEKLQAEIAELRDTVREQRKRQQDNDGKTFCGFLGLMFEDYVQIGVNEIKLQV